MVRTEKDSLGSLEIPAEALYGIHAARARTNFPGDTQLHPEWYRAMGSVKVACYRTYRKFLAAASVKHPELLGSLHTIEERVVDALERAAIEVSEGLYRTHFIVPADQGGAGTSINMNINEIITNAALASLDRDPGEYDLIDPVEDANIYQSTNDVVPTALTIATMRLLGTLEEKINGTRAETERLENSSRSLPRPAYTQMQEAVPSTFSALFSTYNEALSRDWWRVSKCKERIKVVNLGGGATGTGVAIPRFFVMEVVPELRNIVSLPLTRSENLQDATANLDSWVEIHATLKAHAVNLEKMAADLRLLAADLGPAMIKLPPRQVGSSIMPGKINPVIAEYVISSAHRIYANDQLITSLCSQGCLDLNAYLPAIGDALLSSLKLLVSVNESLTANLLSGLVVNAETAWSALLRSPAITTALSPHIGYNGAGRLAAIMKERGVDVFEAAESVGLISREKLNTILEPANLLKLGFTFNDLKR